jgi:hypothetical protein
MALQLNKGDDRRPLVVAFYNTDFLFFRQDSDRSLANT